MLLQEIVNAQDETVEVKQEMNTAKEEASKFEAMSEQYLRKIKVLDEMVKAHEDTIAELEKKVIAA